MLESPRFIENDNYNGSRFFIWFADLCGLSVDLINFLICQVSALFLASLFRSILHPSKVSSTVRHTFALVVGLVFGYFCFGQQAIHIAVLPTICYIIIKTQNPAIVQRIILLVAMTYLLSIHLIRQIYDYGSYSLDITGPLMIITQKVTSLAFSIHDGFFRQNDNLTKAQQYHAVQKLPSALEYFSYILHFQGLMAGPLVFYKDYIEFVEGYNLLKHSARNRTIDNGHSKFIQEPTPTKSVIKKVLGSMVCAFIFMKFVKLYPVKSMKEEEFLTNTSFVYKFWYAMMATSCIRFKYYHAWLLADAICNNSGLGFTGYDKDGNSKWDLISNINVLSFEFATNMRDAINNWNCGTNRWLRTLVYERVPKKYGTLLTFTLSAVWHGFYPGYYLTFATGAIMVTAARVARRLIRHRFQPTQLTRIIYDIITCLTTRVVMGYATFPFVLLEFRGSIKLYLKIYFCLHIIAFMTIYVLPKIIRGEKRKPIDISSTEHIRTPQRSIDSFKENASISYKSDTTLSNDFPGSRYDLTAPIYKPVPTIIIPQPQTPVACARDAVSVKHDQCEMDQLSSKIREKIDAETKNIEEFIDKTVSETVTGIVGLKNDLMRDCEFPILTQDGIRKRNTSTLSNDTVSGTCKVNEDTNAFLKKEIDVINAVVQQANVLPVVLSNGHAK